MTIRLMMLMMAAGALGCGGGSKSGGAPATAAGNPCAEAGGNPCAEAGNPCGGEAGAGGEAAEVDFGGWDGWHRATEQPVESRGHKKKWVDVYVEPAHADAYQALEAPMAEGMRVVKVVYADADGAPGEPTEMTAMAKMPAGYDPDNGDWYYGVFDATGTEPSAQGKIPACINCHSQNDDLDFLFGVD